MNQRINRSIPNLVVLCVDEYDKYNMGGRFYHKYQIEEVRFDSVEELEMKLESLFNQINFPQASTMQRTFHKKIQEIDKKGQKVMQETDKLLEHKGDLATFVLHVKYRQNATWQGTIIWADKKSESNFRSALEMIKLIDSALDETLTEEKTPDK